MRPVYPFAQAIHNQEIVIQPSNLSVLFVFFASFVTWADAASITVGVQVELKLVFCFTEGGQLNGYSI